MSLDPRRLPPIYDAIDAGQHKNAIQACNKILKKHPNSLIVKTLKSLALLRSQKHPEAVVLCDEVFAARPTDENVLLALSQILRHLERHQDIISLYEDAFKKEPRNEELGSQTFMAMVRIGSWKSAQQLSHRLSRTFPEEHRYISWSVVCAILQACESATDKKTKNVLLGLALRLFQQLPSHAGHTANPDKLCLLLEIYLSFPEPKLVDAYNALATDAGQAMFESSLAVDERRRMIWLKLRKHAEEYDLSRRRLERGDRNWLTFASYLDTAFALFAETGSGSLSLQDSYRFLRELAESDGRKERGSHLACLEFEKRLRIQSPNILASLGPIDGRNTLGDLIKSYFEYFGEKTCCFEDLLPYIYEPLLGNDETTDVMEHLKRYLPDISTSCALSRTLSVFKIHRSLEGASQSENEEGVKMFRTYLDAVRSGAISRDLDELDPADGLALLSASHFIAEWVAAGKDHPGPIHRAILVLEFASRRSPHDYQIHLLLIRLYLLIGAHSLAKQHYKQLRVRSLQHETLSHFIMDRATTWCIANDGDLGMIQEALDANQIYQDNIVETPEMLIKALLYEKYSQVKNFIEFEDRLDRSLQRDILKIDQLRMRFVVEPPQQETLALEIGELDYMYLSDKVRHDNRDYNIFPSCQTRGESLERQTALGPRTGPKWRDIFVQIYIRILNRAAEPDFHSPHLFLFTPDDLSELTEAEQLFVRFAQILAEWLWPSEKPRPPPDAAGDNRYAPLPNSPVASSNADSNGILNGVNRHPPFIVLSEAERTGDDMHARLMTNINNRSGFAWEVLHTASLMQEAFVILNIQAMPFAPQTVNGKPKKADPLWASIKAVKVKLASILHDASAQLKQYAEACDSPEIRDMFLKDCESIIRQDAELSKLSETLPFGAARKHVVSAMGRGLGKIADGKRPVIQNLAPPT